MPRKRLPILQKVSRLLITKMRNPIIHFVKARRVKKFKLLRHYNYGFLDEYEFTPSSTPLIYCDKREFKKKSLRDLYSLFFLCKCMGGYRHEDSALAALPDPSDIEEEDVNAWETEEDSVDQRAERFIEWFYQEMRMQRRQSL